MKDDDGADNFVQNMDNHCFRHNIGWKLKTLSQTLVKIPNKAFFCSTKFEVLLKFK